MVTKEDVKFYYKSSIILYSTLYYNLKSLTMHHGFWDKNTKDIHEASLNENDYIAKLGRFRQGEKIVDSGCGVGGTAIYLAGKYNLEITGITITRKQVKLAEKYARKRGVSSKTRFFVEDYTHTNFSSNSLDAIYAIESVSHAPTKKSFLKEAFRTLKRGGRLIIADGYIKRAPKGQEERSLIKKYCESFAIPEFVTAKQMEDEMKNVGFKKVKNINKLNKVASSIKYLYDYVQKFKWVKYFSWLPLPIAKGAISNYTALSLEEKAYELGLFDYAVHYGEK